jgi:hypothetical protein
MEDEPAWVGHLVGGSILAMVLVAFVMSLGT